jgi:hypothetical protein
LWANTVFSLLYFTFARGGYIIRMSPMAMGSGAGPTFTLSMTSAAPGHTYPSRTPAAMARKIQSVRYRSRMLSFTPTACTIVPP